MHLNLALKKKLHDVNYMEDKATHTLGDTLLDDLGVEIEPLVMLENMVEDPDDEADDDLSMHWGTEASDSHASDSLSRSASQRSATSSM